MRSDHVMLAASLCPDSAAPACSIRPRPIRRRIRVERLPQADNRGDASMRGCRADAVTSLIAMSIFCNKSSPSCVTRPRAKARKCAARLANIAAKASCAGFDMAGAIDCVSIILTPSRRSSSASANSCRGRGSKRGCRYSNSATRSNMRLAHWSRVGCERPAARSARSR